MKRLLLVLLCIHSTLIFSQKTFETISSYKLGEDREISISLPESYTKNPDKRYPLLVLLDGDYLVDPFQGALTYGAYWDDIPEVIIVGISQNKNNERETDCSVDDNTTGLPTDKGINFFEFISLELLPSIEKKYRISPFKMIGGHDITAGFLNFFLYKDQPIFNGYISLSPELAVGMEKQIPQRLSLIKQQIFYYHSTADGDIKQMQIKIKELDAASKIINNPNLNYKFDDFKGSTHYSLVLHSIPSALYQFFDAYRPITMNEFNDKIAILPSGYVDYLVNKYDILEKTLFIKMPIRINDFKAIEAAILKNKAYNEFDKLADLADKNYPKTMLSNYHLAMMYEKKEDLPRAIKAYRSAFNKEPIGDLTKEMMLDKADILKRALPKRGEKESQVEEEPLIEEPTDLPIEDKKTE